MPLEHSTHSLTMRLSSCMGWRLLLGTVLIRTSRQHCATLTKGTPRVLQSAFTHVIQQKSMQTLNTHSVGTGLDYPGAGPEHAFLKDSGRAKHTTVTDDDEPLEGFKKMICQYEGIIPVLETSHAIYYAIQLAKTLAKDQDIVINMSGRGDKDMPQIAKIMGVLI